MQGQGGAVGGGDGGDDGQAESEAVAVGASLVVEALEGLKEPVDLVAGNGRAVLVTVNRSRPACVVASIWMFPGGRL